MPGLPVRSEPIQPGIFRMSRPSSLSIIAITTPATGEPTHSLSRAGHASGAQANIMACNTVTAGPAMADGLVKRCNCFPQSEYPRRLMALVINTGWDYHWYRHERGGFWGHKPGEYCRRNYDNSSAIIVNPEMCNRGGYTDFCDYFYAGLSVVIN